MKGKWSLSYIVGVGIHVVELKDNSEEEALKEGKEEWEKIKAKASQGRSSNTPRKPQVSYTIQL